MSTTSRSLAAGRVADELRRSLFAGELAPGTALREVALAESFEVSRPTVREALALLVADGLADRVAHRGTVVKALDRAAIEDLTRARLVFEGAGVRAWSSAAPALRLSVADALVAFRELPSSSDAVSTTEGHLAIHRAIVGLTGSERVLASADQVYAELRLALATIDRVRKDLADQIHSHCTLVEILETGDTEATLTELTKHLEDGRESLLATLSS